MKNKSKNKRIKVKAMCLFECEGRVFVCKGHDAVKDETYFRVIGGSVEFSETAGEAVRREIKEELNCKIKNLKFLTVVESIFTYRGEKGHEAIFLFKGDLSNKDLYKKKAACQIDGEDWISAEWADIADIFKGKIKLYPKFDYKKFLKIK